MSRKYSIFKIYKDSPNESFKVYDREVIRKCERRGFYKKGTAIKTLLKNGTIETPFAIYQIAKALL